MTAKEIIQLLRLLDKFRLLKSKNGVPTSDSPTTAGVKLEDEFNSRERGVLGAVRQWIVWYGRDELSMDL